MLKKALLQPDAMRVVASILFCGIMLTGCADTDRMQSDLDALSANLNDVRSTQAEQLASLSTVKGQVQELSGRLDEIEHKQKVDIAPDLNSVKEDLNSLTRRIPPPAIVPADALEEDEGRSNMLPPDVAPKFQGALQNIRQGKFSIAAGMLQDTLDSVYSSAEAPLVLFWLGVSDEGLNDNAHAVKQYAEIIGRFPKHPRTPLALFRQGSVLIRLGDTKTASLTFKKLIADYPRSQEAARAKDRLKGL